jgi:hypothetical protein
MKIHIIRDSEISDELYSEVLALLSNSRGILDFVSYDDYSVAVSQEIPSHEELFEYCVNFRQQYGSGNRITKDEQVVFLTNKQNKQNWFSSPDFNGNLFVHCSYWNHFDLGCSDEFPIANEVVSTIFHSLLFTDIIDTETNVHKKSIGCINDFCGLKTDIRLKMKTADICSSCLKLVKERKFSIPIFKHITSIIESLRSSLIAVNRFKSNLGLSRIRIRGNFDIELIDEGQVISLEPKELIIYLLLLKHKEGIVKDGLHKYADELLKLYVLVGMNLSKSKKATIVQNLCASRKSLEDPISTIKSQFKAALDDDVSRNYYIWAPKLKPYRIDLDRKLVSVPYSTSLSEYLNL